MARPVADELRPVKSSLISPIMTNSLYYGDNLDVLRESIESSSVDLIYLDPPFNSKRAYNVLFADRSGEEAQAQIEAFDDTWEWSQQSEEAFNDMIHGGAPAKAADAIEAMRRLLGDNDVLAYLVMMTQRLTELHRVLKHTGSLYLHCDPTSSHYLKVMLDAVFGSQNYRNELIWHYGGRGAKAVAQQFPRNHDVILLYSKTAGRHRYQRQYTQRVMTAAEARERGYRVDENNRWFKTAPRGDYTDASIERLDSEGRIHWTRTGKPRVKYFLETRQSSVLEDVLVGDVWSDIPDAMHMGHERLGYPTQKPESLLERIVAASSNEGDVVLDPFCGCGTTVTVAQRLRRNWIGIDVTFLAIDLIDKRLRDLYGDDVVDTYEIRGIPRDLGGAQSLFDVNPFDFERWAVSLVDGQPHERAEQAGDKGVDGWIRFPVGTREVGRAIVSVKGGRSLNPAMVRDLRGTVESQRSELGVLIALAEPTKGMRDEAHRSGTYTHPLTNRAYPRLQIITVGELLAGKQPDMPTAILPYVQAKRRGTQDQQSLL